MKRALLILSMAATLLLPLAVLTSNLLQAQIISKTLQTWDDIKGVYSTPEWFTDGKFGIMMHWGIYSVPARQSEWYVRYMYGGNEAIMRDHIAKYGPLDKFGYKDFIPMFTAAKWDPDAWAELFKRSGAKYIVPSAEHHDGFSLWNSAYYDAAPPEWKAPGPDDPPHESFTGKEIRFTTKGKNLYAIIMDWPGEQALVTSLPQGKGSVKKIELLGHKGQLKFTQDEQGLKVQMPASKPCDYAYALKITGLNL